MDNTYILAWRFQWRCAPLPSKIFGYKKAEIFCAITHFFCKTDKYFYGLKSCMDNTYILAWRFQWRCAPQSGKDIWIQKAEIFCDITYKAFNIEDSTKKSVSRGP
jgi:hypothetical protein